VDSSSLPSRAAELGRLDGALRTLDERGTAVLVVGEPGIGKTALITETARLAREPGMLVLASSGLLSEAHLPYAGGAVVLDRFTTIRPEAIEDPESLNNLDIVAGSLGAQEQSAAYLDAAIPALRQQGRLGALAGEANRRGVGDPAERLTAP
jgi:AAA ATPase domain